MDAAETPTAEDGSAEKIKAGDAQGADAEGNNGAATEADDGRSEMAAAATEAAEEEVKVEADTPRSSSSSSSSEAAKKKEKEPPRPKLPLMEPWKKAIQLADVVFLSLQPRMETVSILCNSYGNRFTENTIIEQKCITAMRLFSNVQYAAPYFAQVAIEQLSPVMVDAHALIQRYSKTGRIEKLAHWESIYRHEFAAIGARIDVIIDQLRNGLAHPRAEEERAAEEDVDTRYETEAAREAREARIEEAKQGRRSMTFAELKAVIARGEAAVAAVGGKRLPSINSPRRGGGQSVAKSKLQSAVARLKKFGGKAPPTRARSPSPVAAASPAVVDDGSFDAVDVNLLGEDTTANAQEAVDCVERWERITSQVAFHFEDAAYQARRDSAEHISRLKARRWTAMDWVFIPAYCFAIP